jgi:hypothetical protein
MRIAFALAVTLVSSSALSFGYLMEHAAVRTLPPLHFRHPVRSALMLARTPRWLTGFTIEICGWGLYVLALALAPLSLVQATAAGGVGILAVMQSRMTQVPLRRHEWAAVALSVSGLALLGISLAGAHADGSDPGHLRIGLWTGGSLVAAVLSIRLLPRVIGAGAAFGIAAGLLFAAGDIATKSAVDGGNLGFVAALIACYGVGTFILQTGFQRGEALVTAGIATLLTNALPIVAGMTIFGEPLPRGWLGAVRIASFSCVVAGAFLLGERRHGQKGELGEVDTTEPAPQPVG